MRLGLIIILVTIFSLAAKGKVVYIAVPPVTSTYNTATLKTAIEMEEFKDVIGYEGHYKVSTYGRVLSLKGGDKKILRERKSWVRKSSYYLTVILYNNGDCKTFPVHRLVADAFIPNPELKETVNHKNGIKNCNYLWNLEWCTPSENSKHAIGLGYKNIIKGRDHYEIRAVAQYTKGGKLINKYYSLTEASSKTGVQRINIGKVAKGERPFAGGYIWKYI